MKTNLSLLSLEKHLRFCPRKAKITIEGFISNFFTLHENDPHWLFGGGGRTMTVGNSGSHSKVSPSSSLTPLRPNKRGVPTTRRNTTHRKHNSPKHNSPKNLKSDFNAKNFQKWKCFKIWNFFPKYDQFYHFIFTTKNYLMLIFCKMPENF